MARPKRFKRFMGHVAGQPVEFRATIREPEPERDPRELRRRRRRVWVGATILVGLWIVLWPVSRHNYLVPEELWGVWVTSAPAYADRFMEFTPISLIFGTGGRRGELYFVQNVERVIQPNALQFTIQYRDAGGGEYRLALYFHPGDPPKVRLKNQSDIVWVLESRSRLETEAANR